MIPHPQRCYNNCKHFDMHDHPKTVYCCLTGPGMVMRNQDILLVMDIGCASYTNEQSPHTPAPAATFSEEECEYLEELILDNIEQYPDSGSFTPEKRDALYQKIVFKMQAGEP